MSIVIEIGFSGLSLIYTFIFINVRQTKYVNSKKKGGRTKRKRKGAEKY